MEAVATAKVILEDQVTEFENIVEDSMFVDPKHHRQLKRAEVLTNISRVRKTFNLSSEHNLEPEPSSLHVIISTPEMTSGVLQMYLYR